jgi:hypothetical protein
VTTRWATLALAAGTVALLGFRSGGYFASEWGLQLGFFALVGLVVVLLAEQLTLRPRELVLAGGLLALAGWTFVSIAWSPGPDAPVLAAEKALVYAVAVAALLVSLSRERVPWLLAGIAAGVVVVCAYALCTRLFTGDVGYLEDAISGSRLAAPIGYANAVGALAALGIVLSLVFVLGEHSALRAAAGAAPVLLAATLYLTLSRGSVIALAAGLVAFLMVEPSRKALGALLLLAPAPGVAVLLVARSDLLDTHLTIDQLHRSGHRLAWQIALLAAAGALAAVVAAPLARRFAPLAWICVFAAGTFGLAAVIWAGPGDLAGRISRSVRAEPPATDANPTRRLLSVSSSERAAYWTVAWHMVEREPLLGEGGGSFERWWLQERPVANGARNAHNLYLEMLAELGPLGLVLLLVALLAPVLTRRVPDRAAAGALSAYVVWLVHAAFDWDWQIPAVTVCGLACGATVLVLARHGRGTLRLTWLSRTAGVTAAVAALLVSLVVHVGNRATDAAQAALDAGHPAAAADDARRAKRWIPWGAQPLQLLGEAQLARRRDAEARANLRRAARRNPDSWSIWYDLAVVTRGAEHARAVARVRRLNPLAPELADLRDVR